MLSLLVEEVGDFLASAGEAQLEHLDLVRLGEVGVGDGLLAPSVLEGHLDGGQGSDGQVRDGGADHLAGEQLLADVALEEGC